MAEGSFYQKNNLDMCFSLKQQLGGNNKKIFESIQLLLGNNSKLYSPLGSLSLEHRGKEKNKYIQLTLSSKKDIQSVIDFFSYSGNYPLIGYKLLQYLQ